MGPAHSGEEHSVASGLASTVWPAGTVELSVPALKPLPHPSPPFASSSPPGKSHSLEEALGAPSSFLDDNESAAEGWWLQGQKRRNTFINAQRGERSGNPGPTFYTDTVQPGDSAPAA